MLNADIITCASACLLAAERGPGFCQSMASLQELQAENQRLRQLLAEHGIPADKELSTTAEEARVAGQSCLATSNGHGNTSKATGQLNTSHGLNNPNSQQPEQAQCTTSCPLSCTNSFLQCSHSLTKQQVERYSRQLLLPAFGLAAQERLCQGSVLIVGCGGLGSPAALYLAAAGVGRIGLVDHDVVDLSNLHRQIIHTEGRVGQHKALSAADSCRQLNSLIKVEAHLDGMNASNALSLVQQYDVVLDASDNPPTRYLVSDACVVARKPLVSAAAVGTDGQLTVYNYGEDGPCYRCLFPESPAPENCSRCADAGVLGPVPGIMGVLQALEVVKVLADVGSVMTRKLLIFDALSGRFTQVNLRGKRPECVACGTNPVITGNTLPDYDYTAFTGQAASDGPPPSLELIPEQERMTVQQFKEAMQAQGGQTAPIRVLDVRPETQVALFSIPGAVHVPFEQLEKQLSRVKELAAAAAASTSRVQGKGVGAAAESRGQDDSTCIRGQQDGMTAAASKLVVLCRRGNNSQRAVCMLREQGVQNVVDVIGGVQEWIQEIDQAMPNL